MSSKASKYAEAIASKPKFVSRLGSVVGEVSDQGRLNIYSMTLTDDEDALDLARWIIEHFSDEDDGLAKFMREEK